VEFFLAVKLIEFKKISLIQKGSQGSLSLLTAKF